MLSLGLFFTFRPPEVVADMNLSFNENYRHPVNLDNDDQSDLDAAEPLLY